MCGITGIFNSESTRPVHERVLEAMCGCIVHRGPDSAGYHVDGSFGMGMRRLSIIDLSTGDQPLFSEDRQVAVVCNGEIYNFRQLRTDLEQRGHVFATGSDAEVIVHLYEEYGTDLTRFINGMFAIGIWDARQRRLILIRDRLGQKPVYYASFAGGFAFGSEIKCLLQHPEVSREEDPQALYDYFTLGYIPSPRSAYKQIRKLPPASLLVVEDDKFEVRPYWSVPDDIDPELDRNAAGEQLRELLEDAVRLRMISDVPIGAFLSGGIDSSIVVALMAQQSDRPVKTFFIDFDDDRYSEREYARAVARRYATDHHEMTVRPNALEVLDDLVKHFDEPFADASAIPTWYVSQLTRQHVTVALAGDGGDESFGGYNRYRDILQRSNRDRMRRWIRPVTSAAATLLPRQAPGKRFVRSLGMSNAEYYAVGTQEYESRCLLSSDFLRTVERPVTSDVNGLVSDLSRARDPLAPYARFDLHWYLPDDILTKVDRMSMAHSLEVRGPLLDYRVIELAARMPVAWKINGSLTKCVLRTTFEKDLPPEVMKPRKRGFSIPLADWMRKELKPRLNDLLASNVLDDEGIFRRREVEKLMAEHQRGVRDRSLQLWRILFYAHWRNTSASKLPDLVTA